MAAYFLLLRYFHTLLERSFFMEIKHTKTENGMATVAVHEDGARLTAAIDKAFAAKEKLDDVSMAAAVKNGGIYYLQDLMTAYESGDVKKAAEINKRMVPLANAMFIETNPIPVKAAVTLVTGIDAGAPRLPLTPMTEGAFEKMKGILKAGGLI